MGKTAEIKKAIVSAKEAQEVREKLKEKANKITNAEEIGGRRREMIELQKKYVGAHLSRLVRQEKLEDMKSILDWVDDLATQGIIQKTVRFQGETFSSGYMKAIFNLEVFKYKEAISYEEYLRNQLTKNWKFSEEEIHNAINGRYKKEVPKDDNKGKSKNSAMEYTG